MKHINKFNKLFNSPGGEFSGFPVTKEYIAYNISPTVSTISTGFISYSYEASQ